MFDRVRRKKEVPEINLIPVMNLFVTLIPFLLLGAAFYHVGVIPASMPTAGSGEGGEAAVVQKVTVNLTLGNDAIELTAESPQLEPEVLEAMGARIEWNGDPEKLEALSAALGRIKKDYAESDTVIVLPRSDVQYQTVVQVLDASREMKQGDTKKEPLFPVVVLSQTLEGAG
ncbi:MAG: biopolymer transporter ExbD [Myxococcota bacterium]